MIMREDPGDNWEEDGGGSGGIEKSSGPWNKTAPAQARRAPVIVIETPEPAMTVVCVQADWSQANHNQEDATRATRDTQ